MANKLLCAGKEANNIVTTMKSMLPQYNWVGLTQDGSGGFATSYNSIFVFQHTARRLCEKNLLLFRIAGPGLWSSGGCDAGHKVAAQKLIDYAASGGGGDSSESIRNYILNSRI